MNILYNNPFIQNEDDDEDDEHTKTPEKKEPMGGLMLKKSEKLFFEKRAIYLWGGVDDKSAKDVVSKLLMLDADNAGKEIKLYINSPGGVVTSGMVIYDTIKLIQSPVSTICMGLAASMGSILLSVGKKAKDLYIQTAK
jgi:ATP-dependent Clp protease protease subunit